jgi:hypothetical protein
MLIGVRLVPRVNELTYRAHPLSRFWLPVSDAAGADVHEIRDRSLS